MNKKYIVILLILILCVGVATFLLVSNTNTTTQITPQASNGKTYTETDVAAHNSPNDCWSSIDGKVYNLTNWINAHPGGSDFIISICGRDGSVDFNTQHSGQRQPESELASFYIGNLKTGN